VEKSELDDPQKFELFMRSIDEAMKAENVPIHTRQLLGHHEVAKTLNCEIVLGDPFSKRILDWFETRYGDRLKIDYTIGRSVAVIAGDPYLVKYPVIYGTVRTNPLEWVKDVTPALLWSVPREMLEILCRQMVGHYQAFVVMDRTWQHWTPDLNESVEHILSRHDEFGQSRWSSLQAAEKVLKAYIRDRGGNPPNIHNLQKLATLANSVGLPQADTTLIGRIQCEAAVRYGEVEVKLENAVDSLHAAIELCGQISSAFPKRDVGLVR
jgi:hypothetical protein